MTTDIGAASDSDSDRRPTCVRYQVLGLLTLAAAIAYLTQLAASTIA